MNCQKCGKNEVNFHYSSNVNGCRTEMHLCSACAAESGYDINKMLDPAGLSDTAGLFGSGQLSDFILPIRSLGGFIPMAIPMLRSAGAFPFTTQSNTGMMEQATPCGCSGTGAKELNIEVDEDMKHRRELNALMRIAVANEEFEKAAELRDKIKALEAKITETIGSPGTEGTKKCDSETTTQDSPTAQ